MAALRLENELFNSRPAIIEGNGEPPTEYLAERLLRGALRESLGFIKTIGKNLANHVGHPLTTGVEEQGLPLGRSTGHDYDMSAFPLQVINRCELVSVVKEKNIFSDYLATAILSLAFRREIRGIFHEIAHPNLQIGWQFQNFSPRGLSEPLTRKAYPIRSV